MSESQTCAPVLDGFKHGFSETVARFSVSPDAPIGVAVSGGSDSLALLHLASAWAHRGGRTLHVYTVDHGLRPESAAEADTVKHICEALGHPHETLVWRCPRASQKAARAARLKLICAAHTALGGRIVLLGHTEEDVIETALMRRARQVRGWAAIGPQEITPAPVWPEGRGQVLMRPLLHLHRADLQAKLIQNGVRWSEDPSNVNMRYERARVRARLSERPALLQRLRPIVQTLQQAREQADRTLAERLVRDVEIEPSGVMELRNWPASHRVLSCLVRYAGGHAQPPKREALQRLIEILTSPGDRAVLGGAWFQRTRAGVRIGRDPAVRPQGPVQGLWDGRYQLTAEAQFPAPETLPILVRAMAPSGPHWQQILSERRDFESLCFAASVPS